MARESRPSRPPFAHWFLYSSAYESWDGLKGWFRDRPGDDPPDANAPSGEADEPEDGSRED